MAVDLLWWQVTKPVFAGEKITTCNYADLAKKVFLKGNPKNSGVAALMFAESQEADKIIMLGYDCKYATDGRRHWHGDHVEELGTAVSMPKWKKQLMTVTSLLKNVDVVNCTRDTALNFWPLANLEEELCR